MKKKFFAGLLFGAALFLGPLTQTWAIPLDLSTFTAEEGAVVTSGGGGGLSASRKAILQMPLSTLYDLAFLVDPLALSLTFEYAFTVGLENDDWLVVKINDTYLLEEGGYNDPSNPLPPLTGSKTIDTTGYLPDALAFDVEVNDDLTGSFGAFSNIEINSKHS